MTIAEVCGLLGGVRRQTVYEMLKDGRLRGRKVGKHWHVDPASVHQDMLKKRGHPPRKVGGYAVWWGAGNKVIYSRAYWELGGRGATLEDLVIAKIDAERDGMLAKLLKK